MEKKLILLKVVVGIQGLSLEEINKLSESFEKLLTSNDGETPGYMIRNYIVHDPESSAMDIQLLYPPTPEAEEEKEYLQFLIEKGKVPAKMIREIQTEIKTQEI